MPIIACCHAFLAKHAVGKWFESYRFKAQDDSYVHPIHRGMLLLRVETGSQRAFYWIYSVQDALRFSEFVGLTVKAEAHEIIITPRCRMFYDIDLPLDGYYQDVLADHFRYQVNDNNTANVMEEIAQHLALVYKNATLISLQNHGVDLESELVGFDWMFTLRNRPQRNHGYKISIHLITNLMLPLHVCAAVAAHEVLRSNVARLGISEDVADLLADSVDETQYRRHGSLGLPFGTKKTHAGECTSWVFRGFAIPGQRYTLTVEDQFSLRGEDVASRYQTKSKCDYAGDDASPQFVKNALANVYRIPDYNERVWDINTSVLKGSTMFVKRYAPSMCSVCQRVHDHDNTLFLIFNEQWGVAFWKCVRSPDMCARPFYRRIAIGRRNPDPINTSPGKHDANASLEEYEDDPRGPSSSPPPPRCLGRAALQPARQEDELFELPEELED